MKVYLSAEAETDLERIGDYIAQDNPTRALSFVRELRTKCLGLADFPQRFALVPGYESHHIRHRVHGNYVIFYRLDTDDRVIVIHILHGATDFAALIFPS